MITSVLFDFSITSILLFFGYLIRRRVTLFQKLFLPAPLIAGVLGLLLGPHVLGLVSPVCLQYSEFVGQTSLPLLCCVFCTQLFMMKIDGGAAKKAFHAFALLSIAIFVQILLGIGLVRGLMPGANDAYGMLPFTSFFGGPGICTIVSNIVGELSNFSIDTANSIGNTYATISMLSGVTIGMIVINVAKRKGILAKSGNINDIPKAELTGFVEESDRVPVGQDVTNGNSLNSMTLQFVICGTILFVGMVVHKLLLLNPKLSGVAVTVPVILVGLPIGWIFKAAKWDRMVDQKSVKHFASIALEIMITQTIANTNLTVFSTYGKLMIITSVVVILTNIIMIFGLGRLWFRNNWIENSIGEFGTITGVAVTGMLLLRTADPDDNTGAFTSFCTAIALILCTTQLVYLNIIPMFISEHGNAVLGGTAIALIIFLVLGFVVAGKRKRA